MTFLGLLRNRAWPLPEPETASDGQTQIETGKRVNPMEGRVDLTNRGGGGGEGEGEGGEGALAPPTAPP